MTTKLPTIIQAGGGKEVWAYASLTEPNTIEQAKMMARHPIVTEPVRLMADCHAGVGGAGTVGSAIVMEGGLIPAAIGPDIGCGMVAVKFNLRASDLTADMRQQIFDQIEATVPMGKGKNSDVSQQTRLALHEDEYGELSMPELRMNALTQMGTLGSGNHFIEVSEDQNGDVWAIVHSGSRGVGFQLARRSMEYAKELTAVKVEHPDLSYLPLGGIGYAQYVYDMLWAQGWAKHNRYVMMQSVTDAIRKAFGSDVLRGNLVECHHNYGEDIGDGKWLIRKGAISAYEGDRGIIPGSMGTDSYLVTGKGNAEALNTAPHGAGRLMARGVARRSLSSDDFVAEMDAAGRVWGHERAKKLLDEAPKAYKPIETVIADSESLISVDYELSAIINCKG